MLLMCMVVNPWASLMAGDDFLVGAVLANKARLAAKSEQAAKMELVANIKAATFTRAEYSAQAQIIQHMIACGRLAVVGAASDEEWRATDEAAEDEHDSEADFIDDDEIRDDDDASGAYAAADGEEALRADSAPLFREIRIVETSPGAWSCVPPRNPLLGYRSVGSDGEAGRLLDAVRRQFAFYDAVARWLQEEEAVRGVLSGGAVGFRRNHAPMTQIDFCRRFNLFAAGEGEVDTSGIHGYCRSCRLAWRNASLPLDCVFGGMK